MCFARSWLCPGVQHGAYLSPSCLGRAREGKVSGCRGVGPFVLMLPSPRP